MRLLWLLLIFAAGFQPCFAESEKELEKQKVLQFSQLRDILKEDMLEEVVEKKEKKKVIYTEKKQKIRRQLYYYPNKSDLFQFSLELWLVREVAKLKWNFTKPDYGVMEQFKKLLEELGFINQKFRILFLNDINVTHFALPYRQNEVLFLLSVPFVRSLDLSKKEIAILLLEDFLRFREKTIEKKLISQAKLDQLPGDFQASKKPDLSIIEKMHKVYSDIVYQNGYSFQEMFEVTQKMNSLIKSRSNLWGTYFQLIKKIDVLVKEDNLYKNYIKIYPSPEMQMKWLSPKKEVL